MPPDATETKQRILVAATSEFAGRGLAGARIDRIADSARVNKRSIYVHFGPKEELFDLIVGRTLSSMAEAVEFTAADLSGYAARLFDYLRTEPDTLRLMTWANLERPTATPDEESTYGAKTAALRGRFGDAAADVLAMALGLTTAWAGASPALIPSTGANELWTDTRREMLIHAVSALELAFDRRGSN